MANNFRSKCVINVWFNPDGIDLSLPIPSHQVQLQNLKTTQEMPKREFQKIEETFAPV